MQIHICKVCVKVTSKNNKRLDQSLLKDFKSLSHKKQLVSVSSCLWINCSPGQQLTNQDRRLPNQCLQGEITFLPKKPNNKKKKKNTSDKKTHHNPPQKTLTPTPQNLPSSIGALEVHTCSCSFGKAYLLITRLYFKLINFLSLHMCMHISPGCQVFICPLPRNSFGQILHFLHCC